MSSPESSSSSPSSTLGDGENAGWSDDEFIVNHNQAVREMNDCHKELVDLNEKEEIEIAEVESKYNKLKKPIYDKRAVVIEKIPNFWVIAIVNHPQISKVIDEEEEDCLNYLKKLEVEMFENVEDGYRITLVFEENPFFDNSELVKEFQLGLETEMSTSTTIKWKENMDLSKKQERIIAARRKRGLEMQTFFSWFSDNTDPADDCIAKVMMEDLWPNALHYYLTPDFDDDEDYEGFWEDREDSEDDEEGNGEGEEEDSDKAPNDDDKACNGDWE